MFKDEHTERKFMRLFASTQTDKKHYILKRKNIDLLEFCIWYDKLGQPVFSGLSKVGSLEKLPMPTITNIDDLEQWVRNRFIPKNRKFVESLFGALPDSGDTKIEKLLDVTLCLSLTDDFWVVPRDAGYRWEDHSLFRHQFSETLALIAFTGHGDQINGLSSSPEFTTDGMLRKCWRRIDDTVYLYKGGTEGYANAGLEPYSEMYATQVAEVMGINHVKYSVEKWKGILCSVCELFTSEQYSLIPAFSAFGNARIVEIIESSPQHIKDQLLDMLVFDAVIVNSDRHFGNFGLLQDNETGKFVSLAPAYDHGISLLNYAMEDDLQDIEKYLSSKDMTFAGIGANRLDIIKTFVEKRQREMLRRLLTFEFKEEGRYNLPPERLKLLSRLVRDRASKLL